MSGVRRPTDQKGGIWDYLIDHSVNEGRIYFLDGSWIFREVYSSHMDFFAEPQSWSEYAVEFQKKMRNLGYLQNDMPDPFIGDEFCDGLG